MRHNLIGYEPEPQCCSINTYFNSFPSPQIDEESPFFEMTPQSLLSSQFEIVVVMEGVTEETGNTVQARQWLHPAFQEEFDGIYFCSSPKLR